MAEIIEKIKSNLDAKIILIYLVFFTFGLINFFGYYTLWNNIFVGIAIIVFAHFLFYRIITHKSAIPIQSEKNYGKKFRTNFFNYFLFTAIFMWFIYFLGLETGYVFGRFEYNYILLPRVMDVPIAVGFIWFIALVSSVAVVQKFTQINLSLISNIKKSLIVALLMTVFEYAFEGMASKMGYWSWQIGIVPAQNYLAWFVFASIIAFIGFKFNLLNRRFPKFITHIYFALLLFFILSSFSY